jgi:hypothetical protein
VSADVFRGKTPGWSRAALGGYAFHGVTAVLALLLAMKGLGL